MSDQQINSHHQPSTPKSSLRKRKRQMSGVQTPDPAHVADDEQTLRGSSRAAEELLYRNALGPIPLLGSSSSTSAGSNAARSTRSRSPVKRMSDLRFSDIPVEMHSFGNREYPTPSKMLDLCRDLRRIGDGFGVIPHYMKECMETVKLEVDFYDMNFAAATRNQSVPGSLDIDIAWHTMLDILDSASECLEKSYSESAWNSDVHSRVLRFALSGYGKAQGVWFRDITTASIHDPSLLPTIAATSSILQSKMVDYALVLEPQRPFEARIIETLRREGKPSINQTNAEYARFAPIAVSIETKRAAIDETAANVQLSMWVAAHMARLRQLAAAANTNEDPPGLPAIIVQGHDWKFTLAYAYNRERTVVLKDILIGATNSMMGLFRLIAGLRRLARWVDEEYRVWFDKNALNAS
ncbi:MAG: hypothetical protein M1818_007919 [Claussenomyces sp. TS43310]|nr:MAG: hypothetical protein M1818_007919 [Claussenomyces sp. TS43310]